MPTIGETLTKRAGPLPVWAWTGLGTLGIIVYMKHKQSTQAAQAAQAQATSQGVSSNLGTVPLSNLTTDAAPMPIQMGDTFVNVSNPTTSTTGSTGATGPTGPPGPQGPPGQTVTHTLHQVGNYGGASWAIQQGGSPGAVDLFKNGKFFGSYWLKNSYQKIAGTPFSLSGAKLQSGQWKADVKAGNQFAGVWTL